MSEAPAAPSRRARLAGARLYFVLPSAPSGADTDAHDERLPAIARAAVAGGVDVVQLREKERRDEHIAALASDLARVCAAVGALFIVNDSPALAVESGADGVHVGQDDMSVAEVRSIVGDDMLIGLSTHTRTEIDAVRASERDGSPLVDYIGVGPVHETPTKPGRPAVGTELVAYAAARAAVPFFAIGGLDASNLHEVLEAGATRAVILRAIADSQDPERAARELRAQLDAASMHAGTWQMASTQHNHTRPPAERARPAPQPLGAGERPLALWVSIGVCAALAVAVLVGAVTIHDLSRHGGSLPGAIFLAGVFAALANGMYHVRYLAVLAFEALLAFQIVVTSLALVVASTIAAALGCAASIALAGALFWKLVGVMGRIQATQQATDVDGAPR